MKEIKLVIDNKLLEEYQIYWKKFHPTSRNHPLAKPKAKDKTKGYPFVISINEFTNIPNRIQQNTLKQNWSDFIQWWCKKEGIVGWNLEYCKISYRWFFPDNRRRDADNFGLANKFICDGLIKAKVMKDDCLGKLWLEYDCHKYVDKDNPRVEVTIEELENFEEMKTYTKANNKRLFSIWTGMKSRCYNKNTINYCNYGKKGISICEEWRNSFEKFCIWALSNGYDETLSIDRIDPNGNYEPNNCRWATNKEQANNRTSNRYITIDGTTKTLQQWVDETGVSRDVIEYRSSIGLKDKALIMTEDEFKNSGLSNQGKNDGHLIEYNGEIHNIKEWAKIFNMKESLLSKRITQDGSPFEKAILSNDEYLEYRKEFNKHLKMYEIEGEKHTLKEWSEISEINYSTLKKRMSQDNIDIKTALLPSKDYRKRRR